MLPVEFGRMGSLPQEFLKVSKGSYQLVISFLASCVVESCVLGGLEKGCLKVV